MRVAELMCPFWVSFTNLWRSWPANPGYPLKTQFEWQKATLAEASQLEWHFEHILSAFWGREPNSKRLHSLQIGLLLFAQLARPEIYATTTTTTAMSIRGWAARYISIHFSPNPTINYGVVPFFFSSFSVDLLSCLFFWPREMAGSLLS